MAGLNPQILITARDEASKVLKGVADSAESTGKSLGSVLKDNVVELGAAFAAVTGVIVTSIGAYSESEQVAAQLNSTLKATGNAAGVTAKEVLSLSSALQQQSMFSDEAITTAQTMLLQFGNIGGKVMPDATKAILDVAQGLHMDLTAAAKSVGLALSEPADALNKLRRQGIFFSKDQQNVIDQLVKTGDVAQAQRMIIEELNKSYGGSAAAAASTFAGQMTILKNNINDLQETIGKGLLEALGKLAGGDGFQKLNELIIQANTFLTQHQDVLVAVGIALITVAGILGGLFVAALIAAAGAAAPIIAVIGAIAGIIAFLGAMVLQHWTEIQALTLSVWNQIILVFQMVQVAIQGFVDWFISIPLLIQAALLQIGQFFIDLFTVQIPFTIGFIVGYLSVAIPTLITNMINWIAQLPPAVLTLFTQVYNNIVSKISQAWAWISGEVSQWVGRIQAFLANLPSIVGNIFESAKSAVLNKMSEMWDGVVGWWNKIKGVLQGIIDAANAALNAVKNAFNAGQNAGKGAGRATGGMVPGAIGTPQMVLAHGGEEIVPYRSKEKSSGGSVNLNVYLGLYAGSEMEKRNIAAELYQALVDMAGSQNKSVSELFS